MTDKELLLDLFQTLADALRLTIKDLSIDALRWQPDEEANNIAVTVWHISRALDLFKVCFFENRAPEEELWYTRGWAAKTGYDPKGIGRRGFGNLVGYTQEEVKAVPILSADDLLAYFDQVYEAMVAYLHALPAEALYQPAAGSPVEEFTTYNWLRNLLVDGLAHWGEIKAIEHMWERRNRTV
jgi:hypothetical protein